MISTVVSPVPNNLIIEGEKFVGKNVEEFVQLGAKIHKALVEAKQLENALAVKLPSKALLDVVRRSSCSERFDVYLLAPADRVMNLKIKDMIGILNVKGFTVTTELAYRETSSSVIVIVSKIAPGTGDLEFVNRLMVDQLTVKTTAYKDSNREPIVVLMEANMTSTKLWKENGWGVLGHPKYTFVSPTPEGATSLGQQVDAIIDSINRRLDRLPCEQLQDERGKFKVFCG
jgi:hypothetical protein